MKLARSIILILLCVDLVPSVVLGQTDEIDALKEKAEQGYARAQHNLGRLYFLGMGVPKNSAEAVKWYRKAAEQGYAGAQHNLGFMYDFGMGVPEDKVEAVKWYRKAAEQGNASAQLMLGLMYEIGRGVPEDDAEAVKWYRKAAEQGNDIAQYNLGHLYLIGKGVPKNYAEAVKWYRKAAEQGYAGAQNSLGVMYGFGKGVPEDYVEAYKWANLAAAQGFEEGQKSKNILAKKMTPQQIAEAQRLSAAFKPRKETPNKAGGTTTLPELVTSQPDAFGSGFYVTSNGYLLTNQHVVNGARKVFVYSGSQRLPAQVVKTDAANDLALLKVSGTFAALPVSSSRRVKLGQTVSTVGFPNPDLQGKSPKLTKGEISSLSGASDDPKYFQISVPVQPGNSGGPLVDGYGNVVGVVTAKLSTKAALATAGTLPENVNYAVKGTFVMGFLESVPEVAEEMLDPNPRRSREFTDVVNEAEKASVMILVYE